MFELVSKYKPSGDQPEAIEKLVNGIKNNEKHQVLLGATGTGKTLSIVAIVLSILWLVFCACVYFGMGADCSSLGGGYYY